MGSRPTFQLETSKFQRTSDVRGRSRFPPFPTEAKGPRTTLEVWESDYCIHCKNVVWKASHIWGALFCILFEPNIANLTDNTRSARCFDILKLHWRLTGCWVKFAILETRRKLGRVNLRKDFWDCDGGQWKILANQSRPEDQKSLRKLTRPSFLLVS